MVHRSETVFSESGDQHKRGRKRKLKEFKELSTRFNDEYQEQYEEAITSLRPVIILEEISSESEGRWFDLNLSPPEGERCP